MRLTVSTSKLYEKRSDEQDVFGLVNEMRDRVLNQQYETFTNALVTTDATPTVIWTEELPANCSALVTVDCVGVTGDGTEASAHIRWAVFRRPGTAAVVQVGTTLQTFTREVTAGWDTDVAVSVTTGFIEATVTGAAATTITWRAHVTALVTPWR